MQTKPEISIIIPFLNEESNIERLSKELCAFTQAYASVLFEIILVNDGSTDRSREKILSTVFPERTILISFSRNYGSHAALRAGIQKASGRFITFLYADLQDPISNVLRMYEAICQNMDIVWAFREKTENKASERVFSRMYANLMKKYVNRNYPEQGFDVVMFNQKVAAELNKNVEANSSVFLQILNLGFRSARIFYRKEARIAGKSKWTLAKKIKLFIDSFVAFSFAPIRLVSIVGVSLFFFGLLLTGYIIVRRVLFNDLMSGWAALMSVLLIGFGVTNIALGILAEYLWRTLDASRKRPVFIVDEIIALDAVAFKGAHV
jgi:polyisoprenyl-phosphate glycosyltransferase